MFENALKSFNLYLENNPKVIKTIALGSCSDQRKPMYHWKSINNKNPDLFILTGDNVYGDFKDGNAFEFRLNLYYFFFF